VDSCICVLLKIENEGEYRYQVAKLPLYFSRLVRPRRSVHFASFYTKLRHVFSTLSKSNICRHCLMLNSLPISHCDADSVRKQNQAGLRSRRCKTSEVFGWRRIPNNTRSRRFWKGRSWSRTFYPRLRIPEIKHFNT